MQYKLKSLANFETLSSLQVRRYRSPDEHPFYPNDIPEPLLPPIEFPNVCTVVYLYCIKFPP